MGGETDMPKIKNFWDLLEKVSALEGIDRRLMGTILETVADGALGGDLNLRNALIRNLHAETGRLAAANIGRIWCKNLDKIGELVYKQEPTAALPVMQQLADQACTELLEVLALIRSYPELVYAAVHAKAQFEIDDKANPGEADRTALDACRSLRSQALDRVQRELAEVGQALVGKGEL
jgi:hypothetical protein